METPTKVIHTSNGVTYYLDFLLVIETFNHVIIQQTPDDTSRYVPNRSFWTDIKEMAEQGKIAKAALVGKGRAFSMDLVYGFCTIDGLIVYPPSPPPVGSKFQLIYYRTTTQQNVTMYEVGKLPTIGKQLAPKVAYYIGWKIMGTTKKWELGVS
jgi:hypothetical protein